MLVTERIVVQVKLDDYGRSRTCSLRLFSGTRVTDCVYSGTVRDNKGAGAEEGNVRNLYFTLDYNLALHLRLTPLDPFRYQSIQTISNCTLIFDGLAVLDLQY